MEKEEARALAQTESKAPSITSGVGQTIDPLEGGVADQIAAVGVAA